MRKMGVIFALILIGLNTIAQSMRISHDQLYIVPAEYCVSDDIVGQLYVNCTDTVFNERMGTYGYTILSGNTGNAFSINSQSGMISIAAPDMIKYGNDFNLAISITIDNTSETVIASIHVIHPDSVYFIDPYYSGTEDGSRQRPFNEYRSDIEPGRIKPGFTYLWKRGTICQKDDYIYIQNSGEKTVYIGAYGTGERPILDGRLTCTDNGILVGGAWKCPADQALLGENIRILDLHIRNYNYTDRNGVRVAPSSRNVQLHRILSEGGHNNGCFYLNKDCNLARQDILVQDCQAMHNPVSHLLKSEAGGVTINNFWGWDAPNGTGISNPVSPNNTVTYFYLTNIGETGINARKQNTSYNYGYISNVYRGAYIYDDGDGNMAPDNCSFKNIIIENTYSYGFQVEDGDNLTFEGVEVRNVKSAAIMIGSNINGISVLRSKLHDNYQSGIEINGNSNQITLAYNLIYGNESGINIRSAGNSVKLNNNVILDNIGYDAYNSTGSKYEFINNIFGSIVESHWNPYSNNYDNNSQNCLTNPRQGDFYPKEGSSIIDNGADLGYKIDFDGVSIPQNGTPDIGAFEYSTGGEDTVSTIINHAPQIIDQDFSISPGQGTISIGALQASDPDAGQKLKYTIVAGNESGIFSINENTGGISCNSNLVSESEPLSYVVTIQVKDNGIPILSDNAALSIHVVPESSVFYIDPSNSKDLDQNGSLEHPYDSWQDVIWKEGGTYLQKKNTTSAVPKINIYASNVTLGSYGEGSLPVVNSNVIDFVFRAYDKTNITFKDLHIKASQAISCIYLIGSSTENIIVENCKFEGAQNGVRIIDGKNVELRYNTFIGNSDAIYSFAENTRIYYNVFIDNSTAINISSSLSSTEVYNNVFYNNEQGVSTSYSKLTLYNNIFYLTKPNAVALNQAMKGLVSDNNIFYPEQDGFLKIAGKQYNSLNDYQQSEDIDLNSFSADPMFVDVYNRNFNLSAESPAINTGKYLGNVQDMLGTAVPFGTNTDIGVFEASGSVFGVTRVEDVAGDDVFEIYPNPSQGIVNLKFITTENNNYHVIIADLSGKVVYRKIIDKNSNNILERIDLSNLPAGLYAVNISTDKENYSSMLTLY
jgi:hypothetical protein